MCRSVGIYKYIDRVKWVWSEAGLKMTCLQMSLHCRTNKDKVHPKSHQITTKITITKTRTHTKILPKAHFKTQWKSLTLQMSALYKYI